MAAKLNPLDGKFVEDNLKLNMITNDMLQCKDCEFKFDDAGKPCNTSKCEKYQIKPSQIYDGGKCDEYIKEK